MNDCVVFNYGGGRQTVAMCVMVAKGVLPKPDVIVMADTGRENPMTFDYLDRHINPLLDSIGLKVNVASHDLATVKDIYALNGDVILPVFSSTGKFSGFCSNEWKKRVVDRWLKQNGFLSGVRWLGLALDEKRRWIKQINKVDRGWKTECPLVDFMINTDSCLRIIKNAGLPEPHISSCWMCPHKRNSEWKFLKENHPDEFSKAIAIDEEIRNFNLNGRAEKLEQLFLHQSRVPLKVADLDSTDRKDKEAACSLGMCFI